ncbi:MAG: inositol monophosphatase family protein [Puniceicoccales bacterium]|jgi:myo-inositol-1(or 4)-monophosphatase|nr:inositol monophosphatase family protein [Puniceicoccales bacterium]
MSLDIPLLHEKALAAAAAAAAVLRAGADRTVNLLSDRDVKLQADVDAERQIRGILAPTGLPVVGEELGGDPALYDSGDAPYWVLDPLDGTYNYLRDQPAVCVSLALMRGREPLCGVVHDFQSGRVYAGRVGGGVSINGVDVTPRWAAETSQACLMTGFPAAADMSPAALAAFVRRAGRFKKIRMIGSAALAVAYVGTGRADVYLEDGTNLWDVAAGLAIVKAAGGVYALAPAGRPLRFNLVAAGKREWLDA